MPIPFGVSVGDFIATITLVKDIITALNDTNGAKPAYQSLRSELVTFDAALTKIQSLEVVASQESQKIALQAVACQCRDSIHRFLTKNTKFQKSLGQQSSSPSVSKWRGSLHKLQWALFKEDSIEALRAEVAGHTATINLILNLIEAATLKDNTDAVRHALTELRDLNSQVSNSNGLANRIHDLLVTQAEMVTSISLSLLTSPGTATLQSMVQQVLELNMRVYSAAMEVQRTLQDQIPRQIDREQPIYFEDAHGRTYPLHPEFVDSLTTFQAVLEIKFRDVPGVKKVQRREYIIWNANSGHAVELEYKAWSSVFRPGARLNMSMAFWGDQYGKTTQTCPACLIANEVAQANNADLNCSNPGCGLSYRRLFSSDDSLPKLPGTSDRPSRDIALALQSMDGIASFRRVTILPQFELDIVQDTWNGLPPLGPRASEAAAVMKMLTLSTMVVLPLTLTASIMSMSI